MDATNQNSPKPVSRPVGLPPWLSKRPSMEPKLVVVEGHATREEIEVRLPLTIGREQGVGLVISHPLVSRQHCTLTRRDGFLWVKDMGSSNGTYVNGQRVAEGKLEPGDRLTIGPLTFVALYQAAEAVSSRQLARRLAAQARRHQSDNVSKSLSEELYLGASRELESEQASSESESASPSDLPGGSSPGPEQEDTSSKTASQVAGQSQPAGASETPPQEHADQPAQRDPGDNQAPLVVPRPETGSIPEGPSGLEGQAVSEPPSVPELSVSEPSVPEPSVSEPSVSQSSLVPEAGARSTPPAEAFTPDPSPADRSLEGGSLAENADQEDATVDLIGSVGGAERPAPQASGGVGPPGGPVTNSQGEPLSPLGPHPTGNWSSRFGAEPPLGGDPAHEQTTFEGEDTDDSTCEIYLPEDSEDEPQEDGAEGQRRQSAPTDDRQASSQQNDDEGLLYDEDDGGPLPIPEGSDDDEQIGLFFTWAQQMANATARRSSENHSGENRAGENRAGENRAGENRSGENRSGENRSGEGSPNQPQSGDTQLGGVQPGQDQPSQVQPGQVPTNVDQASGPQVHERQARERQAGERQAGAGRSPQQPLQGVLGFPHADSPEDVAALLAADVARLPDTSKDPSQTVLAISVSAEEMSKAPVQVENQTSKPGGSDTASRKPTRQEMVLGYLVAQINRLQITIFEHYQRAAITLELVSRLQQNQWDLIRSELDRLCSLNDLLRKKLEQAHPNMPIELGQTSEDAEAARQAEEALKEIHSRLLEQMSQMQQSARQQWKNVRSFLHANGIEPPSA